MEIIIVAHRHHRAAICSKKFILLSSTHNNTKDCIWMPMSSQKITDALNVRQIGEPGKYLYLEHIVPTLIPDLTGKILLIRKNESTFSVSIIENPTEPPIYIGDVNLNSNIEYFKQELKAAKHYISQERLRTTGVYNIVNREEFTLTRM